MSFFEIKQGDRSPSLAATITDDLGAVNLTTATSVAFHLVHDRSGVVYVDAAAAIVNAALGTVAYPWDEGDTDTPGLFRAEFEVLWGDGKKQTAPSGGPILVLVVAQEA